MIDLKLNIIKLNIVNKWNRNGEDVFEDNFNLKNLLVDNEIVWKGFNLIKFN